jgi:hypothetical protein
MGFHRGPNIVRDGLVLALDAASPRSYPGSGTTWYDLSGNGHNHTINGSPIYTNGAFTINETQSFSYNSVITSSTTCTVSVFYKTTDIQELWVRGNNNGSWYIAASNNNNYYHDNAGSPIYTVDLNSVSNPNASGLKNGNYHMWEAKNVNFSTWTSFQWWGYGGSWNMNGTVAKIMVYNRTLSTEESEQNFNAHQSRFGL